MKWHRSKDGRYDFDTSIGYRATVCRWDIGEYYIHICDGSNVVRDNAIVRGNLKCVKGHAAQLLAKVLKQASEKHLARSNSLRNCGDKLIKRK